MEVSDRLDQLYSVQHSIQIQIVHRKIVELQLFGRHVGSRIDFTLQMLLNMPIKCEIK